MSVERPPSPSAWLWAEIARRFGVEAAQRLHADYLEQHRAYGYARHHSPETPPGGRGPRGRRKPRKSR